MCRLARLFAAITFVLAGAEMLAAGEDHVAFVPWEVLEPGALVNAPLILFWIPATGDELRRSQLLTSGDLTLFSTRCVAMRVVRLTDDVRLTGLAAGSKLPLAVLTDRAGEVIGRVENQGGELRVDEIEDLVRDELDRRTSEAEAFLDRAREHTEARAIETAVALYESVWEERCVCPRQARDARRALKKLGRR